MRIETLPPNKTRDYTPPVKEKEFGYAGKKMKHVPAIRLVPRSQLFGCPKCIGGVVKEEVDDFQLVLRCLNCGWTKCSIEPEKKHYAEARGNYDKRY
jgi:hypothetical protein